MITTTLAEIRSYHPSVSAWRKLTAALGPDYGDATPLAITRLVEFNGITDALWALVRVHGGKRIAVAFAADCAEHVLPLWDASYPDDDGPRNAIHAARGRYVGTACIVARAQDAAASAAYAARAAAAPPAGAAAAAAAAAYAAYAYGDHASNSVAKSGATTATAAAAAYAAYVAAAANAANAARDAERDAERAWQKARLIELMDGVA